MCDNLHKWVADECSSEDHHFTPMLCASHLKSPPMPSESHSCLYNFSCAPLSFSLNPSICAFVGCRCNQQTERQVKLNEKLFCLRMMNRVTPSDSLHLISSPYF